MEILQWLLRTDSGVMGLILRITLAVVIFPYGAQKALGWFGGHGFKGTMKSFTDSGIPTVFALLAIAAEFRGVSRSSRPCRRVLNACGRLRHRMHDARCYRHRSLAERLFHELGGKPESRGIRISLAGAGHRHNLDDRGAGAWSVDGALAA